VAVAPLQNLRVFACMRQESGGWRSPELGSPSDGERHSVAKKRLLGADGFQIVGGERLELRRDERHKRDGRWSQPLKADRA
jgi:hypothetical protein